MIDIGFFIFTLSFLCIQKKDRMDTHNYIDAYLSGTATQEEAQALLEWVRASESNKKEFTEACKIWYSLHSNSYDSEKAFQRFSQATRGSKTIPLWKKLSSAAAIALLAIGCYSIFNKQDIQQITITNNELAVKAVMLPDSSQIFLQNGASITYPEKFDTDARNISTNGNVFCEIQRNESAPFTLSSNSFTVTVLGTSFQVNEQDSAFVVVETGKVKVTTDNQSVIIEKGERADLCNQTLTASNNTDVNFLSWKTNKLVFNNANLSQVYVDLARHYNCSINTNNCNKDLKNIRLTGTYEKLTLNETLNLIALTIPDITYEIAGNNVIVSDAK